MHCPDFQGTGAATSHGFGRYRRLRISARKGSPGAASAVSKSTTAKPGSVGRYSSQRMGTCQAGAAGRTKEQRGFVLAGVGEADHRVGRQAEIGLQHAPEHVRAGAPAAETDAGGGSIWNGSRIRAVSSRWPRRMPGRPLIGAGDKVACLPSGCKAVALKEEAREEA